MATQAGIPLLDVAALRGNPSGHEALASVAQMDAACVNSGFFVVTGHGLDDELMAIFAAARSFFALPADEKQRVAMVGDEGYVPIGGRRAGAKEMYDVGYFSGAAPWPRLDGFREVIERYQVAALALAADVLRGLAIALDIGATFFADRMQRPQCFLRLLRYPPGNGAPTRGGDAVTGAHTDYGTITVLATDGVPGLEIRATDDEWTPVEAPPGSGGLVVNLGDMLARWTNGRYASTAHRVVDTGGRERLSVPFFVNPDPDTTVACLPSCVSPANPCRFEPITAAEFLRRRIDGTIPDTLDA